MAVPSIEAVKTAEIALEFIRENPRLWDQSNWMEGNWDRLTVGISGLEEAAECGTSCCFAGWFALADGAELHRAPNRHIFVRGTGQRLDEYVAERLGLPEFGQWPLNHMFDAGNGIEKLQEWVELLQQCAEQEIDVLEHPWMAAGVRRLAEIMAEEDLASAADDA